jgi:flagellar motor component MotA
MKNKKDYYRIIEKDKFFIQKKRKMFGWVYMYDTTETIFITVSILFFVILGFLIASIFNHTLFLVVLLLSIIFLLIRYSKKRKFNSYDQTLVFITREINEEEIKEIMKNEKKAEKKSRSENLKKIKEKRRNFKIHYLSEQAERRDKLKKLS